MQSSKSKLRILDFDVENRPLSYLGMDFTSAEITAIGWSWVGDKDVGCFLLNRNGKYEGVYAGAKTIASAKDAFESFARLLEMADVVTGHYIRKHDLPVLNAAMMENRLPPLPELLVQDTKCDLVRRKDLSASQENLSALLGLKEPKHHMSQSEWREANRLTPKGLKLTRERVVKDVQQHKALRLELVRRNLLKPPRIWRP